MYTNYWSEKNWAEYLVGHTDKIVGQTKLSFLHKVKQNTRSTDRKRQFLSKLPFPLQKHGKATNKDDELEKVTSILLLFCCTRQTRGNGNELGEVKFRQNRLAKWREFRKLV